MQNLSDMHWFGYLHVFGGQAELLQTVPWTRLHSYVAFLHFRGARMRACSTVFDMRCEVSLSVWSSNPIYISMEPGPTRKSTKHTTSFVNCMSEPGFAQPGPINPTKLWHVVNQTRPWRTHQALLSTNNNLSGISLLHLTRGPPSAP
jgi:hypothetical protein